MSYSEEEEYQDQQNEAEYLEYEATYRRMYERGYAAGHAVGRAEQMCRIYQQEPLVVTDKKWQGPIPF